MTPRKPLTPNDVVAAVLAGHLDDSFDEIELAMANRIIDRGVAIGWKIHWKPEDLTVTVESMTPGDYAVLYDALDVGYGKVGASLDEDMGLVTLILALHLARRDGIDVDEAKARIDGTPGVRNLVVSTYEVAAPLDTTPSATT